MVYWFLVQVETAWYSDQSFFRVFYNLSNLIYLFKLWMLRFSCECTMREECGRFEYKTMTNFIVTCGRRLGSLAFYIVVGIEIRNLNWPCLYTCSYCSMFRFSATWTFWDNSASKTTHWYSTLFLLQKVFDYDGRWSLSRMYVHKLEQTNKI